MPRGTNSWVSELLTWHGQERGGVRVPFQSSMGRPLGSVVATPLIDKLRSLARDLANGVPDAPRWLFLVGGPGNGKSEAVEAFINEVDIATGCRSRLTKTVAEKFSPRPVTPRHVTVEAAELEESGDVFSQRIRRLILIQDASAVDGPSQNAEEELIDDLGDLLTSPSGQEPVFICCANRGLLARARSTIQSKTVHQWLNTPQVTGLLTELLIATGVGPSSLTPSRPRCWPLDYDPRFAAWPLDLNTIMVSEDGQSPFEQMLLSAVEVNKWQGQDSCGDCTSRTLCPFYSNAAILREEAPRRRLLRLLRHAEMATGQRWNFRDAFSLCAELLVGQRDDFRVANTISSPCTWTHERVDEITLGTLPSAKLKAAWDLAFHLYQQALFPEWPDPGEDLDLSLIRRSSLTQTAVYTFRDRARPAGTQVRRLLASQLSRKLDPARATPTDSDSLLRSIEDEFGQSIQQGLEGFRGRLSELEKQVLELLALAENDWSETVREVARVRAIVETLRCLASILVKRSLGVYEGEYLNLEYLREYETLLRDPRRIRAVVAPMRSVLAPGEMFSGSLVRVFGQPTPEPSRDVVVTYPLGSVLPRVAPQATDDRPGHDIPWVEVEDERIPLTFDLFITLRLSSAGAELASFPPHTRAAIDKVRNAISGRLSRDKDGMLGGGVSVKVGMLGKLVPAADDTLEFQAVE